MSSSVQAVTTASFHNEVVSASSDKPVLVDFWAPWCGPCRTLGPVLEQAVDAHAGEVELVKVNTDEHPRLAARFAVRGIPAVKGFRDGQVVDEFVGALPRAQVEAFVAGLVPS